MLLDMAGYKFYAIIVAGGVGKRMNTSLPKQFLVINNKPILMHTIQKFADSVYRPEIVLVLGKNSINHWQHLVAEYNFNIPHIIVEGGAERFHSVKNGLSKIFTDDKNAIVAIHDAVRPLISVETINNCYKKAQLNGNAVAAVVSKDSVRIAHDVGNASVPRNKVYLVQTPQVFIRQQLQDAYLQEYCSDFTDDASVVEKAGYQIFLEEGDHFNIKITYPEDILLAQSLLNN